MNKKDLKIILDSLYLKYSGYYSSKDPVWILRRFDDEKDIETAGFITSCFAYGKVELINKFILDFFEKIDFKVHEFTLNYSELKDKKHFEKLYYRFNTSEDLSLLLMNLSSVLRNSGSLKNRFSQDYSQSDKNIIPALTSFTAELNVINRKNSNYNYLVPSPENNSACKRLNLFLRWMIRNDNSDLGIWSGSFDKSKLVMPVDTHIYRISKKLKLVKRNSCDLKFALELTESLKKFDKYDPVKYDFALCHYGIDKEINLIN